MDANQFRQAAHAAVEEIIEYFDTLPSRKVVSDVSPGYLRPMLPAEAPEMPQPWSEIQPDFERVVMPGLTHWQHPAFMAFFPASTSFPSIVGEMYSAAFTAPAFNWLCSPAVTELETVVLDWIAKATGLPSVYLSEGEGGGVIQGSASEAIVTVMVAARERLLRRTAERDGLEYGTEEWEARLDELRGGKLVALGSDQAHSSTQKACIIASTKYRTIPVHSEDKYALRGKELRRVLQQCKEDGLIPYYLTVTLGTTTTCAVDDFDEIADVLKDWPDVWVHVDAAYAGAALFCPEYQHLASRFGDFDSFDFNMHKWLLTNFDANCLYIKKRSDLTSALSITPSYLRNTYSDSGLVIDYRDWQIPLGRRFRSLKIWFVLRTYGISGLQGYLRRHIKLGELFHSLVLTRPDLFTVLTGPAFALTVISVVPRKHVRRRRTSASQPDPTHERYLNDFTPDAQAQALMDANNVTREVYEAVNRKGEIFLTSSMIGGIYAIRVVSANPGAEEKFIRKAFAILVQTAEKVLAEEAETGEKGSVANGV